MTPVKLIDGVVGRVAGSPLRLRVALSLPLVAGCAERLRVVVPGLVVGGLRLGEVDARAKRIRLVAGIPPKLRAERIEVRVRLDQADLDEWMRSVALPVRFRLRDGALDARTGVGGFRFGGVEVGVAIDERGRLRIGPRRVTVLGVAVAPFAFPSVALPLPPLPRRARLQAFVPEDGAVRITFVVNGVDEELTPVRVHELVRSWRSLVGSSIGAVQRRPARTEARAAGVPGVPGAPGSAGTLEGGVLAGGVLEQAPRLSDP